MKCDVNPEVKNLCADVSALRMVIRYSVRPIKYIMLSRGRISMSPDKDLAAYSYVATRIIVTGYSYRTLIGYLYCLKMS